MTNTFIYLSKLTGAPKAAALIGALGLATLPLVANAEPSYAVPGGYGQTIQGRVTGFDGHYSLAVRDSRGYIDNVQLHQGTVINPTGLTLEPGMNVTVTGVNDGSYFVANEIDAPNLAGAYGGYPAYANNGYPAYGAYPYVGYYGGNYGYGSPVGYSYSYAYPYPVYRGYSGRYYNRPYPVRGYVGGVRQVGGRIPGPVLGHGVAPRPIAAPRPISVRNAPVSGGGHFRH